MIVMVDEEQKPCYRIKILVVGCFESWWYYKGNPQQQYMQTIINHVENNANANNHSGFHLIVLMQPPEDEFAPSLIPREVVESQTIARCIRRRSKAEAINGEVASMRSPTLAC